MKRRALVTGASGVIGSAICRRLAADGCEVIAHANSNLAEAEKLAAQIGGSAIAFDVSDADVVPAMIERLLDAAPIQILVNNAGIHDDAPLAGMTHEQWRRVIDVSLEGFYNVTRALVMPMARTRWGRIVSVSSVTARIGTRGQANYAAAKAAVEAASRTLAREMGSRGITVNCVAPAIVESPATRELFDAATIASLVPLQRAARPEEVAAVVAFLASDAAAYITGQTIPVNGGML
jgi:3-oxoacyl-[acyl-carrier protein] reductase